MIREHNFSFAYKIIFLNNNDVSKVVADGKFMMEAFSLHEYKHYFFLYLENSGILPVNTPPTSECPAYISLLEVREKVSISLQNGHSLICLVYSKTADNRD